MTPADIEALAREAGMIREGSVWFCTHPNSIRDVSHSALEKFAALVRAQALEEAAKVCDERGKHLVTHGDDYFIGSSTAEGLAAAIRALANQPAQPIGQAEG